MCYTPLVIHPKESDRTIPVPCGRCEACYKRKVSGWSFRLRQQEKVSESAYFITLTYDNEHAAVSAKGFLTLRPDDCTLFFKKLRKAHSSDGCRTGRNYLPIKYYLVGEYGGRTKRPHYHAIVYNASLELMFSKQMLLSLKQTDYDGATPVVCRQWEHGTVTVGKLQGQALDIR